MLRSFVRLLAEHPRLTALLGALLISWTGVLYRYSQVSPETAAFFRAVYAMPILLVAAILERRAGRVLSRRGAVLSAVAGVFFAIDLIFWHRSVDVVGSGMAMVLGNLQVVVVAIGAWALLGERPPARTLLALPIMLVGIVFIGGVLGGDAYGSDPPLGVALGIVAAFAYAGYLLVIRRAGGQLFAQPVAISVVTTALVSLATGIGVGSFDATPSLESHFWLLVLGITGQALGYLFITLSLPRLPAVLTSIILLAQPVLAVLLAVVLLHETPSPGQMLGVILVIGGIALATVSLGRIRLRSIAA